MTLIPGNDNLPANDDVGEWAKEKHECLIRYLNTSSATRKKYLGPKKGGATYIDLFCATGLGRIKGTQEWIDGSAVAAWKASVQKKAPFSMMYIADHDEESLKACAERLIRLGAPVKTYLGNAADTVHQVCNDLGEYALNFAFIDPYNLESLDFRIIERLSPLRRIDTLIHFSVMDLNRNLTKYLKQGNSALDTVFPSWRDHIDLTYAQENVRNQLIRHWRRSIKKLGTIPSIKHTMIRGGNRQPLYWLVMTSKEKLAHDFWAIASNPKKQGELF